MDSVHASFYAGPLPPPIIVVDNSDNSKAGNIAYEIFGLIPVTGTFIGIHHTYKAITSDEEVDGWEIAKIITQLFSFLIIPQIVLGIAYCIKMCADHTDYSSIDPALLPPPITTSNADVLQPLLPQALTPGGLPFALDALDENGLPIPLNYAGI